MAQEQKPYRPEETKRPEDEKLQGVAGIGPDEEIDESDADDEEDLESADPTMEVGSEGGSEGNTQRMPERGRTDSGERTRGGASEQPPGDGQLRHDDETRPGYRQDTPTRREDVPERPDRDRG